MVDTGIKRRIEEPAIKVQAATWGNVLKREGIGCFEKEKLGEVKRGHWETEVEGANYEREILKGFFRGGMRADERGT